MKKRDLTAVCSCYEVRVVGTMPSVAPGFPARQLKPKENCPHCNGTGSVPANHNATEEQ